MQSTALYRIPQIREIEQAGLSLLPKHTLMQRAAAAVAATALRMLSGDLSSAHILVLAGPGNNGGDGCEAAAILSAQGIKTTVYLAGKKNSLPPDAAIAFALAQKNNCTFIQRDAIHFADYALVIDGLFGIGLSHSIEDVLLDLITSLNKARLEYGLRVLAIDIPSGLHADTGCVLSKDKDNSHGIAVHADQTITFIANKPGLHTASGRDYAGLVETDDLALPENLFPPAFAALNHPARFACATKKRNHASHKGSYGDVKILGGATGMIGAVVLAARMALYAGAGRVYAVFLDEAPGYDSMHPEIMCRTTEASDLHATCLVVGPGLGMNRKAHDLLSQALSTNTALILDADALNLIAVEPGLQAKLKTRSAPSIMTPHPLEAARLLNTTTAAIQADRMTAANKLATLWKSVVVLKGSGSVIAHPDGKIVINTTGNPALATAGTGDVLAGCCGALLAQAEVSAWDAACAGTWLHGKAADTLAMTSLNHDAQLTGLTASELIPAIRKELNQLINLPNNLQQS